MSIVRSASGALLCLCLSCPSVAQAQRPTITLGIGAAWNCLASVEEIPLPYLICRFDSDGAGGPYGRPYVSIRPLDRLLITTTLGYVTTPRQEWPLCCSSPANRSSGVSIQYGRTAWHGQLTAAYVTGAPSHPMRAFVGSGVTVFDDTIVTEVRPGNGPTTRRDYAASGLAGLFVTGALIRMGDRVEGRLTYTLANRMTATNRADTSWRHEFGIGVGWHVRR
ncbi:MAG TPA: hypothetical protein VMF13_04550 [Luteitalea sp.]|nr:hypothetical protein [Luteitalea sp.]